MARNAPQVRQYHAPPNDDGLLEWPSREPFYPLVGREVELFEAAYRRRLPILPKGPTGCGKTRVIQFLITMACHNDPSAHDPTGRFLMRGG